MRRLAVAAVTVVAVATVAVAAMLRGSDDPPAGSAPRPGPPAGPAAYPVSSRAMTTQVPAKVDDVCAHHKSRRALRITVLCPTRVPAGVIDARLGAGMLVYLREPRLYLLAFHSNEDPMLRRPAEAMHWFAGAGTRQAFQRFVFSQRACEQPRSVASLTRRFTFQGVDVRVYRAPHYPRGGMFGDHTLALARCPAPKLDVLGSAHGYQHEDVSIALAVNLARHRRCQRSGG